MSHPATPKSTFYRHRGKRWLDLCLLTVGAPLVVLPLAMTALAVRCAAGAPVFFRQRRPGRNGQPFTLFKFRTMREADDAHGHSLPDKARLTRVGSWLRRTSLDELPELWNVLRGEMSFVGPRPLLMEYLDLYTPEQARRHAVAPGITGWAQVRGRNALSWAEKFQLDVWYVDRVSLALDLRILGLTVRQVLAGRGVSAPGYATMPRFEGPGKQGSTWHE